MAEEPPTLIRLPEPRLDGTRSLEWALLRRRSSRRYLDQPLSSEEVSQILWAAQGITGRHGSRTAPSAGATYPLVLYLAAGTVESLPAGLYRYLPEEHALTLRVRGDLRRDLCSAALGQRWVREGAATVALAAIFARTARRYGERGRRYVQMEAGHVQQNIHLQAAVLRLGTVVVGAFDDDEVRRILSMPAEEVPLSIMPLGRIG